MISFIGKIFVELFITFVRQLISLLLEKISVLLYGLYVALLKIIDILQDIFTALSGTNYIYYEYSSGGQSHKGTGYLTQVLLEMPAIKSVFWKVWTVSVVLCFLFLIAAVLRSIGDLSGNGQSVNDILKQAANTFVLFFAIQVIAFGSLALSNVVISSTQKSLNYALDSSSDIRMANCIFAASAINAGRSSDEAENKKDIISQMLGASQATPNWSNVEDYYPGKSKYYDITDVQKDLVITKIDYLSGLVCVVFVLKFMAGAALVFVQRIVYVVLGLIIAPFFVAITPLDGGARFERWKSFFIGSCFSSLGVIVSVSIYFMLVPMFVADGFIMSGQSSLSYIIRLYSIVILSLGFEKSGAIVNRILSDAGVMSTSEAFESIVSFVQSGQKVVNGVKGGGKQGGGNSGK
jgi:hypothetical protein